MSSIFPHNSHPFRVINAGIYYCMCVKHHLIQNINASPLSLHNLQSFDSESIGYSLRICGVGYHRINASIIVIIGVNTYLDVHCMYIKATAYIEVLLLHYTTRSY